VDAATIATYDRVATAFADRWWSTRLERAMDRFVAALPAGDGPVGDLGCGPGRDGIWLSTAHGRRVVALDASAGMLAELVRRRGGTAVEPVQGDLCALPLADGALAGAWVCASLLHLTREEATVALGEVRHALQVGGALFAGVQIGPDDELRKGDRFFTRWTPASFAATVERAGLVVDEVTTDEGEGDVSWVQLHGHR
jgi:SAM-dependent methyltransferase